MIKPEHTEKARELFAGTGINIITEGKRYLRTATSSRSFTEEYIATEVLKWSDEIKQLVDMARTQPHAAYCAYIPSRWTFLSCTIPDIADLLQQLEEAIQQHLIPTLTGCPSAQVWRGIYWPSQSAWVVWDW